MIPCNFSHHSHPSGFIISVPASPKTTNRLQNSTCMFLYGCITKSIKNYTFRCSNYTLYLLLLTYDLYQWWIEIVTSLPDIAYCDIIHMMLHIWCMLFHSQNTITMIWIITSQPISTLAQNSYLVSMNISPHFLNII